MKLLPFGGSFIYNGFLSVPEKEPRLELGNIRSVPTPYQIRLKVPLSGDGTEQTGG